MNGVRARRVLIVASAYCRALLTDMQRARMLAWELPALGCLVCFPRYGDEYKVMGLAAPCPGRCR